MLQNKLGVGFMPLRIAESFLETGEFISIEFESYEMPPLEENFIMYNRKRENRILPIVDAIMEYVKGNKWKAKLACAGKNQGIAGMKEKPFLLQDVKS